MGSTGHEEQQERELLPRTLAPRLWAVARLAGCMDDRLALGGLSLLS
jgi:hypothetical protein